jgi:hypothetical protein
MANKNIQTWKGTEAKWEGSHENRSTTEASKDMTQTACTHNITEFPSKTKQPPRKNWKWERKERDHINLAEGHT